MTSEILDNQNTKGVQSFDGHQSELVKVLQKLDTIKLDDFHYFLKGDISGIQDFIFSVKSKRASRTLKGRSFFIHVLSELGISLLKEKVGENNLELFYNGGGNFYLLMKDKYESEIKAVQAKINQDCADLEVHLSISVAPTGNLLNEFQNTWKEINGKASREKLLRFGQFPKGFLPQTRNYSIEPEPIKVSPNKRKPDPFEAFARKLIKKDRWGILPREKNAANVSVGYKGITFFDHQFHFSGNKDFEDIIQRLPIWTEDLKANYGAVIQRAIAENQDDIEWDEPEKDNVIEFEYLAAMAKERTGTEKLGILKMDVDNLGKLFQNIHSYESARKASRALKNFFGDFLKKMLNEKFEYLIPEKPGEKGEARFFDHIYVVFAGGDDCFFLGGWDAIYEFALRMNQAFGAFSGFLKQQVPDLRDKQITLSAALVMVGPKFPVSRFAALAEEEIKLAKARKGKNAISVFGKVLSWEAFAQAGKLAQRLTSLIYHEGERRAILERLQRESVEFEKLKERTASGIIQGRSAWRLLYSVRRTAQSKNLDFLADIAREYAEALAGSLVTGKPEDTPDLHKVPVAARWAEFLTRL